MASRQIDLSDEWDPQKLRNWMENARRMKREDVHRDAFRQLCRTEGRDVDDPLDAEFAGVMRALEQTLADESGKTKRLTRTRHKLGHAAVRKAMIEAALKKQPSPGFLKLVEFDMAEISPEALIVKYEADFSAEVVDAARRRLAEYEIALPVAS